MKKVSTQELWAAVEAVRRQAPLVHNITNFVVMNSTANLLLAAGASPVMAHAAEEVEDMVTIAGALVINMGTLDPQWVASMGRAWRKAKALGRPVIFDPVGVGATPYRNNSALELLALGPTVIRGNASEILMLHSLHLQSQMVGASKGVDATHNSEAALEQAAALARSTQAVVVVSGATDHIFSPQGDYLRLTNGDVWMSRVTGTGCGCTALIGACCAVQPDYFRATAAAMAWMGVAGQMAAAVARQQDAGVGTFASLLLDKLQLVQQMEFTRLVTMQ